IAGADTFKLILIPVRLPIAGAPDIHSQDPNAGLRPTWTRGRRRVLNGSAAETVFGSTAGRSSRPAVPACRERRWRNRVTLPDSPEATARPRERSALAHLLSTINAWFADESDSSLAQ